MASKDFPGEGMGSIGSPDDPKSDNLQTMDVEQGPAPHPELIAGIAVYCDGEDVCSGRKMFATLQVLSRTDQI